MLSITERVQRVRNKSLEFLKSLDPNIEERSLPQELVDYPDFDDHYYVLKKS